MRECRACGAATARSVSVPAFLIPSQVMGEYETPKTRRLSAPLKRPPGLFPLDAAGTYGPTPEYITPPPQYVRSECGVHAVMVARNQPRHRRSSLARDYTPSSGTPREEEKDVPWAEGLRRHSVSSQSSGYSSLRTRTSSLSPERMRRVSPSPSFPSRPSSRRSVSSESHGSSDTSVDGGQLSYLNRQLVSPRGDMYRLLTRDLREALREEEGEEQEDEEEEEEQEEIDSMGILGLSNKLYKDTRRMQECFLRLPQEGHSSQAV